MSPPGWRAQFARRPGPAAPAVAYAVATGAQQWLSSYNGPGNKNDQASALALSPDGRTLYVTGVSSRLTSEGFATIAYQT